jgi:4-aminobutyrate aminotransferase-like enzyme
LQRSIELGLIINLTQKNVLRICPALTISEAQLQQGMELLDQAMDKL